MNKRIGNLEFRWSLERQPEIVAWESSSSVFTNGDEYCYTLLWWTKGSEGWSVDFVGSRPFEWAKNNDLNPLWNLMKYGDAILRAAFDLEDGG